MVLNLMINVFNVILNTLFIYAPRTVDLFGSQVYVWGFGWGVGGAAFASGLSTAIVACLFLVVVFRKKSPVQINLKQRYRFDRQCLLAAWKLGLPAALERSIISLAQIVITALITGIGTVAVAANHLAVTAESISYLPASGVAVAGTTLVGQAIGAGRKDLAQRFARTVSWMGIVIMTFGGSILFFFAPQLIQIFSTDPEVIDLGSQVLRIVAFAEPLFGASIVASGALRGAGDSRGPSSSTWPPCGACASPCRWPWWAAWASLVCGWPWPPSCAPGAHLHGAPVPWEWLHIDLFAQKAKGAKKLVKTLYNRPALC